MTSSTFDIIDDLERRGLVAQMSSGEELTSILRSPRTLYAGFDPTAESLHIGNLVPLLALRRFQLAGHRPIALVGGATGLIGDPSFKASERQLNSTEIVEGWVDRIKSQVSRFVDFDAGSSGAISMLLLSLAPERGFLTETATALSAGAATAAAATLAAPVVPMPVLRYEEARAAAIGPPLAVTPSPVPDSPRP